MDPTRISVDNPYQTPNVAKPNLQGDEVRNRFADYMTSAVDNVNDYQVEADNRVEAFLKGDDVPIHEVMMELGKAETSMRLMTTVIQKAIAAYNEISRMQV